MPEKLYANSTAGCTEQKHRTVVATSGPLNKLDIDSRKDLRKYI